LKHAFLVFKLIITASLCFWLYTRIDFHVLRESLIRLGALPIVIGVLLHVMVVFLSASRWWMLLTHTHAAIPFFKAFPSYYLGVFFNNFLPTGLGGDTVRILHMRVHGVSMKSLVSASVVDRAIGFATIFMVGMIGILFSQELRIPSHTKSVLTTVFLGGLLLAGWMLSDHSGRLIESLARKYRHTRIRRWILDVVLTCYSYRAEKKRIAFAVVISAMGHGLVILTYYLIGNGLGLRISLTTYLVVIPAVFLAVSLPVSIGGLGIREGALVGLLVAAGADLQLAINLSLVYLIVFWISTLPGALVPLLSRTSKIASS
jgi:uncharacterized protein (TIRG00374 family)